MITEKIQKWAVEFSNSGAIDGDIVDYVTNFKNVHAAKCKPLIKTHKPFPYPHRLLLSGSGTPTQPLSKFVQLSLSHLTQFLKFQIIDTKDFLRKIEIIKEKFCPLPPAAVLVTCDVISLYPSVDNDMGVPAVSKMLDQYPSPLCSNKDCIIQALDITLNNNACYYEHNNGCEIMYASPNTGTAMGPCHAPDYVDIFMGELDNKLVETSPIEFLGSNVTGEQEGLCWSRFRDDGFVILPNEGDVEALETHLQTLCPGKIKWTVNKGKSVEYLDVKVTITEEGHLKTDVFSKNSHSYLPPFSCHPPSVFKGLATAMGRRLRVICSNDVDLEKRLNEYTMYLVNSGWNLRKAKRELRKGANVSRAGALRNKQKENFDKVAWVSKYDPRNPSKSSIIHKNLNILYSNPDHEILFPRGTIIGADRRRKNIGELCKPTTPRRFPKHGPENKKGFYTCKKNCDTCRHSSDRVQFSSKWDNRKWYIREYITCTTPNVIYVLECQLHPDFMYVGSTMNLKVDGLTINQMLKMEKQKNVGQLNMFVSNITQRMITCLF